MASNKNARKLLILGVILITITLMASVLALPFSELTAQSGGSSNVKKFVPNYDHTSSSLSPRKGSSTLNPAAPSHGMTVDPTSYYSNEPAPMGIADYGLGSQFLGVYTSSYYYYTPSFLGTVNLDNLAAVNASDSQSVTFQLNVVMYFVSGGSDYSYWIQDVVHLNTSTNVAYFEDNVWNYSASSSQLMYPSSISGGGVVENLSASQAFYYDYAANSLPGNNIVLNDPSSIQMMVNSTMTQSGLPGVSFMYNDGHGWVTYDNVVFPFATSLSADDGFVVDGAVNTPSSNYYDAELILGGNGGGATTTAISSNVNLTLQYWNGNNYQATPGAFNYGSNTAETVTNIVSSSYYFTSDGSLFEEMTSGAGTLGQMYNPSDVASLNISTENPTMSGTLYINGSAHPFVNGGVNLTLGPGEYNATIYTGNLLYNHQTINLTAGGYLPLSWYENLVTFKENGLPSNVKWWVNLSHQSYSATGGKAIEFYAPNGTFQYTIATSNKDYSSTPSSFNSGNGATNVNVKFTPVLYDITFSESGLASGISWTVSHGTTSNSSTSSRMNFYEMNGTYSFSPSNLSAYYTVNYSITVSVVGHNSQVTVYYDHYAYITGTVSPSGASVSINGKQVAVNNNGQFNISVTAGKYSVVVSESGYTTNETNISLLSGQVKNLQISISKPGGGGSITEIAAIAGIAVVAAGGGLFLIRKRKG